MGKVAIVCTSASTFGKTKEIPTGCWYEELACPYYVFKAAGHEVTLFSPKGGAIPLDGLAEQWQTEYTKRFDADADAKAALASSSPLSELVPAEYAAVYVCGGHGCCTDFEDPSVVAAVEGAYAAPACVLAADCHGPQYLCACAKPDGTPLVAGHRVCAFTNEEEGPGGVNLAEEVPFSLEDKLKELGATFEGGASWSSVVVADGKLVTGQNPQSSEECARACLAAMA